MFDVLNTDSRFTLSQLDTEPWKGHTAQIYYCAIVLILLRDKFIYRAIFYLLRDNFTYCAIN